MTVSSTLVGQKPRVLILGATGQIGSHLFRRLLEEENIEVFGTSRLGSEGGIRAFDLNDEMAFIPLTNLGPHDTVVILAAMANPNKVFDNPDGAWSVNVLGVQRVVRECIMAGARLIFFSSVEVFGGRDGPFNEFSKPDPLNIYGLTKFEIEKYIQTNFEQGRFCIVRTPWNVSFRAEFRCLVKMTYGALLKKDAKMATDNLLSLIDVRDTVEGLCSLLSVNGDFPTPILHLSSPDTFSRAELAERICLNSALGSQMHFKPIQFAKLHFLEARGRDSRMDGSLSSELFGITYREGRATIVRKVLLIDAWIQGGLEVAFD